MTAAGIIDYLISLKMNWLAVLAYGVGYLAYDLTGLCTTDPPALPNFTPERVFGYTNPLNPLGAAQLREDVTALIGHYLWFTYCQCVSGPQPQPGPVPQPPAGQQTDNPSVNQQLTGACANGPSSFTSVLFDSQGNYTPVVQPGATVTAAMQWMQAGFTLTPAGSLVTPFGHPLDITLQQLAGTTVLQSDQVSLGAQETYPQSWHTFTLAPGVTTFRVQLHSDGGAGLSGSFSMTASFFCSAPPTGTDQPCCPPDPVLLQLLTTILGLEQQILSELGTTSTYTRKTQHPNLTGSGSIPISRLRGLAADVTAGTPTVPLLPGNPPYQWDLGWMSISDGGGMIQEQRLTRQHQVWLPPECANAVTFGYFLNPGIVVTFTELAPTAS